MEGTNHMHNQLLAEVPQERERLNPELNRSNWQSYLHGLSLGLVPLILFTFILVTLPFSFFLAAVPGLLAMILLILAVTGYGTGLAASIVCLFRRHTRFMGFGFLTMTLVNPIAVYLILWALQRGLPG